MMIYFPSIVNTSPNGVKPSGYHSPVCEGEAVLAEGINAKGRSGRI
jgi:hypothetical protein